MDASDATVVKSEFVGIKMIDVFTLSYLEVLTLPNLSLPYLP